jgi:D-alanyl-D-alanine carboxypeptidase
VIKLRRKPLVIISAIILALVLVLLFWNDRATAPNLTANQPGRSDQAENPQNVQSEPQFDKSKYSLSDPGSLWVIVNKKRPLNPLTYSPADLTAIGNQKMRQEAVVALNQLIAVAKTEGLNIQPLSGFRSYSRQEQVYQNEVNTNGRAVADTQSAKPGYSEHQTGWAMDLGNGGCGIEDCFGDTSEGKWVAANAYKYGYIIRYPEGKESVTGYRYEPWHIRYIGVELATEMHNKNIQTLEEFFGL